jgi:hypothetical protein
MGWRYIASRLNGNGTETFLDWNLPLSGVGITNTLSGPDALTATINPEVAALKVGGLPLIREWSTAIYAEIDGQIRAGCIVTDMPVDGPSLALTCIGFSGYAVDIPYTGEYSKVHIDPLDVVRDIWTHIQAARNGNIGLRVDPLKSGLIVGSASENVSFTTSTGENVQFTAGPYTLMWYQTTNLGGEIDALAKSTPFEYREAHVWNGDAIDHKLRLGYPTIGRRRQDLRFIVGENIQLIPKVDSGTDYASEALVLGAGTGRKMIRGTNARPDSRLRRVSVVTDSSLTSTTKANTLAGQEVLRCLGLADMTEVTIIDHPHAPLGSFDVGDEILVQTGAGWVDNLALWCRVTSMTISPDSLGVARLTILRTDRITA